MHILLATTIDISAEAAAYKDVFLYGFFSGMGWELFSLFFYVLKILRGGTGMGNFD